MGAAAPNGMNIFPFAVPTQPLAAEYLQDTIVQLLELIAAECVPATGGAVSGAITATSFTLVDGTPITIGSSLGSVIGQASSKVAFFGASTAVVKQVNASASAVATTAVATGAVYGFTTAAQGNALVALANAIITALGAAGYNLLTPS